MAVVPTDQSRAIRPTRSPWLWRIADLSEQDSKPITVSWTPPPGRSHRPGPRARPTAVSGHDGAAAPTHDAAARETSVVAHAEHAAYSGRASEPGTQGPAEYAADQRRAGRPQRTLLLG